MSMIVIIGLLLGGAGGSTSLQAPSDTSPPTPRSIDELKQQLDSIRIRYKVPGAGIALVTRDSILWAGGLGVADIQAKRPVTAETHFRTGSVSKSFVALALLRLVDQGK